MFRKQICFHIQPNTDNSMHRNGRNVRLGLNELEQESVNSLTQVNQKEVNLCQHQKIHKHWLAEMWDEGILLMTEWFTDLNTYLLNKAILVMTKDCGSGSEY